MQPPGLADALGVVMLATAAYCAGRLVVSYINGRATHRDVDLSHVAMGVAMAGSLVPALRSLPNGAWAVAFAVASACFAREVAGFVRRRGWRGWSADECHHVSHYASHFVMSVAMLFMFAAGGDMPAAGAMHSSDLDTSGLPLLLVLLLMVAAVWYADSLARFSRSLRVDDRAALVPAGAPAPAAVRVSWSQRPANANLRAGRFAFPGRRDQETRTKVLSACDARWLAPRQQVAAHIVMCVVMAYMLIVMQ